MIDPNEAELAALNHAGAMAGENIQAEGLMEKPFCEWTAEQWNTHISIVVSAYVMHCAYEANRANLAMGRVSMVPWA